MDIIFSFGNVDRKTSYLCPHEHMVMGRVWLPLTAVVEHVMDVGHIRNNHLLFLSIFCKNNDKMIVVYVNEIILQAKPSSHYGVNFWG